mgnify:CR=1 FL=1
MATPFLQVAFSNDWRMTLFCFCGFSGVMTIMWALVGRERPKQENLPPGTQPHTLNLKVVLRHKLLWMGGLGFVGANLTGSCFLAFYPTLMLDRYHLSLHYSTLILSLNWVVGGIAALIVGQIDADWKKLSKILYVCGCTLPASYILLTLTDSLPLLLTLSAVNGLGWGFFPVLLTVTFHLPGIRIREVPIAHAFLFTTISLGHWVAQESRKEPESVPETTGAGGERQKPEILLQDRSYKVGNLARRRRKSRLKLL